MHLHTHTYKHSIFLQVYDTPPVVMKGPTSQDMQEIYDTPSNVELLSQQMVRHLYTFLSIIKK